MWYNEVVVTVLNTHVGHKDDLRACHLSKSEKDIIACKLNSGVSINRVLKDIRNSYTENLEKIHLTLKQDIHNIIEKYNIKCKKTSSDYVNLESLINELGESAVFYKKLVTRLPNFPHCRIRYEFFFKISSQTKK